MSFLIAIKELNNAFENQNFEQLQKLIHLTNKTTIVVSSCFLYFFFSHIYPFFSLSLSLSPSAFIKYID